ncbi:MAG: DNA repair protein RecN [Oscillospiraceae bacterium]
MLSQLYIRNIAVIKEATIDFNPGFNIFTGETGAGKTILINAINGVLGSRLNRDIIRSGENSAFISAVFSDIYPNVAAQIIELGYSTDEDNCLIISREINADGKNICKINGRPANLQMLKSVASLIIDIHGQRDNAKLLNAAAHLSYIDEYGQLDTLKEDYSVCFKQAVALKKEINNLSQNHDEKQKRIDLLSYQINEIEQASLTDGEEELLLEQKKKILNSQHISEQLTVAKLCIDGDEDGVMSGLTALLENLQLSLSEVSSYLPKLRGFPARVEEIATDISDMRLDILDELEQIDFDPALLEEIEERLALIFNLKRKYGESISEILSFWDNASEELKTINTDDKVLKNLNKQLDKLMPILSDKADILTTARLNSAKEFISKVEDELIFLNMPSVKLSIQRSETALKASGQDEIEFYITTNTGETPKPMSKIASGGELSRIMLSIKNVFAHRDYVATSIFDEIDTGVSGKAAQKIGMKLQQVSQYRQVIAVTHLAQVAVYANHHLFISKNVVGDRTFTAITALNGENRVREISRIISGENITDLSMKNAEEMLKLAGTNEPLDK